MINIQKIKRKIDLTKKESITTTIKRSYNYFLEEKEKSIIDKKMEEELQTIIEIVYLIIEDVCKNEKINISDTNILGLIIELLSPKLIIFVS